MRRTRAESVPVGRRSLIASFAIFSLAVSGCESPPRDSLSILTWNVLYRNADSAGVVRVIREADADVVCLQEVAPAHEAAIRAGLENDYPFAVIRAVADRGGGYAILSRFEFAEARSIPHSSASERALDAVSVLARSPIGPIQFLNVHLPAPRVLSGTPLERARSYLETAALRAAELRHFAKSLDTEAPAIVAGDFNSLETEPGIVYLTGALGFADCFRSLHRAGAKPEITWRANGSDASGFQARIDYVFCSRHLAPTKAEVIRAGESDHWPVRVEVRAAAN